MVPINWAEILRRYADERLPHSIRVDVANLVAYARQLHVENQQMRDELDGAKQTMIALCRALGAGGMVEIPLALVETIDARDRLVVADVHRPSGVAKQFSVAPHADPREIM